MSLLFERDEFQHWIQASAFNSSLETFDEIATLNSGDIKSFDSICRDIMGNLFNLLLATRLESKRSKMKSSFEWQVFNFKKQLQCIQTFKKYLPNSLITQDRFVPYLIVDQLAEILRELYLEGSDNMMEITRATDALSTLHICSNIDLGDCNDVSHATNDLEGDIIARQVLGLVGWAIKSLNDKTHKQIFRLRRRALLIQKGNEVAQQIEDAESVAKFLAGKMRILHDEACQDETYRNKLYATYIQWLNQGGLTLVSNEFFDWGRLLIKVVGNSLKMENFRLRKNNCLKLAWRDISTNTELQLKFGDVAAKYLNCNLIRSVHENLLRKVFNAYAGQVVKNIRAELKSKTNCSFRGKLKATAHFADDKRRKKIKLN